MQPPTRKVKNTVALKNLHSEQLTKLQQKHQHDADLLEDIRNFSKQRSQIEKDYAQALLKLTSSYLSKKEFYMLPDIPNEDDKDHKTATSVWRTVLEVTERIAKVRMQASETYMQTVSEPIKNLRTLKQQNAKKTLEQFSTIQAEVAQSVREMTKLQKVYNEEEKLAHEARQKSHDAEEKVKRRSTSLFSSLATLQKNSAKLATRKGHCEEKSTASRNEYLLAMAACNAHLTRFYNMDLPDIMKHLDGEMFERIQESLTELSKTELECCGLTQECFSKALCDSTMISRQYNLQCFLHPNPVFTETVQYQFDPCENDPIHRITGEMRDENSLDKEAKKWATKIAKENKDIKEYNKTLKMVLTDIDNKSVAELSSPDEGKEKPVDLETRAEECKEGIRKAETAKMKAEARLELLREAGVDVDDWLTKANMDTLSPADAEDEVSHASTSDQFSLRTSSSGAQSEDTSSYHNGPIYADYNEDYDENDETFEAVDTSCGFDSKTHSSPQTRQYPIHGVALYDFQANNTDELTIFQNEEISVIGPGDGAGWVKAQNADHVCGFVPENYIHYLDDRTSIVSADSAYSTFTNKGHGVHQPQQTDQTIYENCASESPAMQSTATSNVTFQTESMSSYSSTDYEVQQTMVKQEHSNTPGAFWAKALYDYDGNGMEELSFQEGQIIEVTRKEPHGVDDGWWEGTSNGHVGVFPSMVVEEITVEDMADDVLSPVRPGPPQFAPPGMPESDTRGHPTPVPTHPPPVTVTLPTPPHSDQRPSQLIGLSADKPVFRIWSQNRQTTV